MNFDLYMRLKRINEFLKKKYNISSLKIVLNVGIEQPINISFNYIEVKDIKPQVKNQLLEEIIIYLRKLNFQYVINSEMFFSDTDENNNIIEKTTEDIYFLHKINTNNVTTN